MRRSGTRRSGRGGGGRGPSALTPASFGTLYARYRARTDEVTLNGATISEWDDLVGDDQSLVQGTAANQPTHNASDANFNGKGSADFDGVNDFVADNAVDAAFKPAHDGTGGTLIIIFRPENVGSASQFLVNNQSGTGTKIGHALFRSQTNATLSAHITAGVATPYLFTTANGTCPGGSLQSAVLRYKEGGIPGRAEELSFRHNGAEVNAGASAAAPSSSNPTEPLHVGRVSTGAASSIYDGQIAEICYFSEALSDAQIAALSAQYFVPEYGRSI